MHDLRRVMTTDVQVLLFSSQVLGRPLTVGRLTHRQRIPLPPPSDSEQAMAGLVPHCVSAA